MAMTIPKVKPEEIEETLMAVDLSPENVSPEPTVEVMPVASHAIPLRRRGEVPSGRTVNEVANAVRMMSYLSDLAREVAALQKAQRAKPQAQPIRRARSTPVDPRKHLIAKLKAMKLVGFAIPLALDNAELKPRETWIKTTGLRLWTELYHARRHGFPKIQRSLRKFIRIVQPFRATRPAATGKHDGKPHKQGLARKSATDKKKNVLVARTVPLDCEKANGTTRR
jgi:hypothetical protein